MITNLYSDLRSTGTWLPSVSDVVNTTGKLIKKERKKERRKERKKERKKESIRKLESSL